MRFEVLPVLASYGNLEEGTIRDARAQLHAGHQDIRYFSDTTLAEPATNTKPTCTIATEP